MAQKRLNTSRLGRAAKLGGLAAGATARQLSTRATNVARSDERAAAANRRAAMETADRMVTVLGTMRGAAMKIGQTLSVIDVGMVDEDLREEFQAKLAKLQHMAPTVAFKDMRRVIELDTGEKLSASFEDFDEEPIAAASIGQVYRATLHDGRDVAVKVQYPGIEAVVRADLKNLGLLLKAGERIAPGLATKEVAQEITDRISEELDYEIEAANHRAMARAYRGHPFVRVPDVITELTRQRVITTEFVEGRKFTDVVSDPQETRNRHGEILCRFYVNGPFRHRLLNGDPHPGNALFSDDGTVAFLDFGFFKHQTADQVEIQRNLLRAVMERDADRMYEISVQQGVISGGPELTEPLMEKYRAASWWFMDDEVIKLSPGDVTKIVFEHADMRGGEFGKIRLPGEQVTTLRAFGLVLGILGQLQAANNWCQIAREVLYDDPPQTELGVAEAEWAGARA